VRHLVLGFAGGEKMHMNVSDINRGSRIGDLLGGEAVLSEFLGNLMARAGLGLILAAADRDHLCN
jgi:hypothetical protein